MFSLCFVFLVIHSFLKSSSLWEKKREERGEKREAGDKAEGRDKKASSFGM